MRFSAICIALCLHSVYLDSVASADNALADRTSVPGQTASYRIANATAISSAAALPAIVFDATMSVDEFNRQWDERDVNAYRLVTVRIPRSAVSTNALLDRAVSFHSAGQNFPGSVQSFRLQADGRSHEMIEVSIRVKNERHDGVWLLGPTSKGSITIQ